MYLQCIQRTSFLHNELIWWPQQRRNFILMCQVWRGHFQHQTGRECVYKQSINLQMIECLWIWWIKPVICYGSAANPHCWIFLSMGHSYLCYLPGWNKLGAGIINNNLKLDHKSLLKEPGHPWAEGVCMNIQSRGYCLWRHRTTPGQAIPSHLSLFLTQYLQSQLFYRL